MNWYYVDNKDKIGPVRESEFVDLISCGKIRGETLVWNESLTQWKPFKSVDMAFTRHQPDPVPHWNGHSTCEECGESFPPPGLVPCGNAWICADCKSILNQKIKEGVALEGMVYAGFRIRLAAKFIDGIILTVITLAMGALACFIALSGDPIVVIIAAFIILLIQVALIFSYSTLFLGRFAATPGKMAYGLRVVTPERRKVSYGKAFGRNLSELLSSLMLLTGYFMAAFDPEKRALHDRICNTRVIRK